MVVRLSLLSLMLFATNAYADVVAVSFDSPSPQVASASYASYSLPSWTQDLASCAQKIKKLQGNSELGMTRLGMDILQKNQADESTRNISLRAGLSKLSTHPTAAVEMTIKW